jgi:hypothetical protein
MGLIEAGIMGLTTMAMMVAYLLFVPFVIMYVLEEIRGRRSNSRDPQLGAKLVSTLFLSVAFQIALMGLAAFLAGIVDERLGGETLSKNAIGLLVGGLVSGIYPLLVYRKVAGNGHARIARQAFGVNALITGTVATFSTVSFFMVLFNDGKLGAIVAVMLVYIVASRLTMHPLLAAETAPASG